MPVEVIEKFESPQVTPGHYPTVELRYTVRGTNDAVEARSPLAANSPMPTPGACSSGCAGRATTCSRFWTIRRSRSKTTSPNGRSARL